MLNRGTLLFALLYSIFCISQTNDLYVLYDDKSELSLYKSSNDSLQIKDYRFDLSIQPKYLELYFENDKIIRKITATDGDVRSISFLWLNENNENDVFLIEEKNVINKLNYNQMKVIKSLANLHKFISNFDEIYLIKKEDFFDGYYITRKVSLRPLDARL